MNFANPGTTNFLLTVLTIIAVGQFVLLIAAVVWLKSAMGRAKLAFALMTGGDVRQIHGRMSQLLTDVETLVSRGNSVLGAVEEGAQDLGAAASAVGRTTQRALSLGSFELKAVTAAASSGLRWFLSRRSRGGFDAPRPVTHVNSGDARG